jgi:hypothetical protein
MRTAKSWRPDTPMLVSGATRKRCHPRRQKAGLRGDYEGTRNTIVQGMPDRFGGPVVTTRMLFYLHTRLRVRRAPGIPCALYN